MKKNILKILGVIAIVGFIGANINTMNEANNAAEVAVVNETPVAATNNNASVEIDSANNIRHTSVEKTDIVEDVTTSETEDVVINDVTVEDVLNPEYFSDEYFRQLNIAVACEEIYTLDDFHRNVEVDEYTLYCWNDVDVSNFSDDYIAPVLDDSTTYMSTYDLTYVYSNDDMTAAFMDLMAADKTLRNEIMTSAEYNELIEVYDEYVNSTKYDVNPYVYHYIAELIDYVYGDKLFDYEFYCETYPAAALLHEYDEDALKQHFYSVGLFEGRQACENFNVDNYTNETTNLGECIIEYATSDDNNDYKMTENDMRQIRLYDPAFEAYVLEVADQHGYTGFATRRPDAYIQAELNAVGTYRSRFELNNHEARGHALINDFNDDIMDTVFGIDWFCENKWSQSYDYNSCDDSADLLNNISDLTGLNHMYYWYQCEDHYNAAVCTNYHCVGQGHVYIHYNPDGIDNGLNKTEDTRVKDFMYYGTGFCIYLCHDELLLFKDIH